MQVEPTFVLCLIDICGESTISVGVGLVVIPGREILEEGLGLLDITEKFERSFDGIALGIYDSNKRRHEEKLRLVAVESGGQL